MSLNRPRPANGKSGDIGTLALMPLVEHSIISGDGLLKDMRCDRDFKFVGMRRPDEYMFAAKFDLGRIFPEIAWAHSELLHNLVAERFGIGRFLAVNFKSSDKLISRAA